MPSRNTVLSILAGGLVGALFTSLTPVDDEEFFMRAIGQSSRAADVVEQHFKERLDRRQWQAARALLVGDEAVEWPEGRFIRDLTRNPVRDVIPVVEVKELSSKEATVAITGTKWWRKSGCQQFTGTFTLTREGGTWLFGGRWRISGKGGGPRPLRPEEIPKGWDCRTSGQKLRDNERPVPLTPGSVRGSNTEVGFPVANLLDHDPHTAWVAGDPRANDHTWLDVYLPRPMEVVRIDVKNGFGLENGPAWIDYDRAEHVTLVNDHREQFVGRLDASSSRWQHLFVAFSQKTSAIRLNVDTYEDCQQGLAISELRVVGVKQPEDAATLRLRAKKVQTQAPDGAVDCVRPAPVDPAQPQG